MPLQVRRARVKVQHQSLASNPHGRQKEPVINGLRRDLTFLGPIISTSIIHSSTGTRRVSGISVARLPSLGVLVNYSEFEGRISGQPKAFGSRGNVVRRMDAKLPIRISQRSQRILMSAAPSNTLDLERSSFLGECRTPYSGDE